MWPTDRAACVRACVRACAHAQAVITLTELFLSCLSQLLLVLVCVRVRWLGMHGAWWTNIHTRTHMRTRHAACACVCVCVCVGLACVARGGRTFTRARTCAHAMLLVLVCVCVCVGLACVARGGRTFTRARTCAHTMLLVLVCVCVCVRVRWLGMRGAWWTNIHTRTHMRTRHAARQGLGHGWCTGGGLPCPTNKEVCTGPESNQIQRAPRERPESAQKIQRATRSRERPVCTQTSSGMPNLHSEDARTSPHTQMHT